jgi:hypothetical protein
MQTNLNTRAKQTHGPQPIKQSAQAPSGGTPLRWRGMAPPRYNSTSLGGWTPPRVRFRLARGSDVPSSGTPPRSGAGPHLSREAPPRSRDERPSNRLARGGHGPAASIPAPLAGAFNALTSAGESTPLRAWESCSGTTPLTPRRCVTLCGMVSNHPAALYHPLLYGRRTAPSKKDDGTLEGKMHDYPAPARDDAVTSGQWEQSPPPPLVLCDHTRHRDAILATASPYPTLWRHAATGHRHASHCALYGLVDG